MEQKRLTNQNAAPESLGRSAQEKREGGTDWGRREIDMETSERKGGGKGWSGRDIKGEGN